jgi:hypothetical protein
MVHNNRFIEQGETAKKKQRSYVEEKRGRKRKREKKESKEERREEDNKPIEPLLLLSHTPRTAAQTQASY